MTVCEFKTGYNSNKVERKILSLSWEYWPFEVETNWGPSLVIYERCNSSLIVLTDLQKDRKLNKTVKYNEDTNTSLMLIVRLEPQFNLNLNGQRF